MTFNLNPLINHGVRKGQAGFQGSTLKCLCPHDKVEVQVKGNVAHNHACGCTKCWKPEGALFSIVGVVPRDNDAVTAHADKLHVVDEKATIRRHACRECGAYMFGRIETHDHPFYGLDFIHVGLSDDQGWEEPRFAAFVSSVIEGGLAAPDDMGAIRKQLQALGLPTYDCLNPPLMDAIATWQARKKGTLKTEG
ncbi:S-(hydroxymethyl)glutathione synthase [Formicincola oecophyllae]|uniref:Glutathione-dependent formaldehyde-activating enzyme n=1 Tax=Formicincola oecophyllae TaxID=2558361 RepID=A0A4Y6U9Z6_9PROT|nr:S-(hydroxymethyl)glutathione synthase [Formicincola oecophyllae]QDH13257.1 S-(hydroxymethyl)glutathione synthase [Formicincola oecophyllae]